MDRRSWTHWSDLQHDLMIACWGAQGPWAFYHQTSHQLQLHCLMACGQLPHLGLMFAIHQQMTHNCRYIIWYFVHFMIIFLFTKLITIWENKYLLIWVMWAKGFGPHVLWWWVSVLKGWWSEHPSKVSSPWSSQSTSMIKQTEDLSTWILDGSFQSKPSGMHSAHIHEVGSLMRREPQGMTCFLFPVIMPYLYMLIVHMSRWQACSQVWAVQYSLSIDWITLVP